MPKYKLSKSDEKWLRQEAKKLPPDFSATKEIVAISGEKAALSGLKQDNDGNVIRKDATYAIKRPNIIPVNHFRRMKKAYEEQKWVGVNTYLDKYRVPEDKIFPVVQKQVEPEKPKGLLQRIRSKFLPR